MVYNQIFPDIEMPVSVGLASGKAGILLLHLERYKTNNDSRYLHWIELQISDIISTLSNEDSLPTYYPANYSYGVAGICHIIRMLLGELKLNICNLNEHLIEMDEILLESCTQLIDKAKFNLFYGLSGLLNYFLTHSLRTEALAKIIDHLACIYRVDSINDTFRSDDGLNYSTAFGLTGFLSVMLKTLPIKQIGNSKKQLIQQIVPELSELTFEKMSRSGHTFGIDDLGWSQGLLMPCLLLYKFGLKTNTQPIMERSLACALQAARTFSVTPDMVEHYSLGSGLSGIKEIFNAFYHETQIIDFLSARNAIEQLMQQKFLSEIRTVNKYNSSLMNGLAGLQLSVDPLLAGNQGSLQQILLIQG